MKNNSQLLKNEELLDVGEGAPEALPTPEEVDARSQERVGANQELLTKVISVLERSTIVSDNEINTFALPNGGKKIEEMRKRIDEITEIINDTNVEDTDVTNAELESQRALLVTELLYTVTGLLKTKLEPKIIAMIRTVKDQTNTPGENASQQLISQLKEIQPLSVYWDALVTNSTDLIKYFRSVYKDDVSDSFLGDRNHALYLEIDKNTQDLPVTEIREGGGTLIDEMQEIQKYLQKFFQTNLDSLQPSQSGSLGEEVVAEEETTSEKEVTSEEKVTSEANTVEDERELQNEASETQKELGETQEDLEENLDKNEET